MRRLIWGFAGHTYHIVANLMSRLNYVNFECVVSWKFLVVLQGLVALHYRQSPTKAGARGRTTRSDGSYLSFDDIYGDKENTTYEDYLKKQYVYISIQH